MYKVFCSSTSKCVRNLNELVKIGVTHVVNTSMGPKYNQTDTNADFYQNPHNIGFHGIPALDVITFKLLPYLRPAAEYINKALAENGKSKLFCVLSLEFNGRAMGKWRRWKYLRNINSFSIWDKSLQFLLLVMFS